MLPLIILAGTDKGTVFPFIFAVVAFIVRLIFVPSLAAVTVLVLLSQLTSAPKDSKMVLIGTRVVPFSITGG